MKKPSAVFLLSSLAILSLHAAEPEKPNDKPSDEKPATPVEVDKKPADPYVAKFGGPYKVKVQDEVSPQFLKDIKDYSGMLRGVFGSLGKSGLKGKESWADFTKEFIDPALAKLQPRTEAEKKMKEAAVHTKNLFAFIRAPEDFPEAERKSLQAFLDACRLPDAPPTRAGADVDEQQAVKFGDALLRFGSYVLGMSVEELLERSEKLMEREKEAEKRRGK